MIQLSAAQLDAWLAALFFPLARIGGLMLAAPVFSNAAIPIRVRLIAGLALALAVAPLAPAPAVPAGSWVGIALFAQQLLIGAMMGFALRAAFASVDVAGELIGLQMGLGFAVFYDPQNAGQSPIVAELVGLLALLFFLALNGHLMMLALLAESFTALPIGLSPFPDGWETLLRWAATLFSIGVLLALPVISALLVANIALGVLTKVAPTLNLFAVGFPVTLMAGFVLLALSMPYFAPTLENLFEQGYGAVSAVMRAAAGKPSGG